MPGIAAKVRWGRAVGAYLYDSSITVTEVGATLRGLAVLGRYRAKVDEQGPGVALEKLLEEHFTPRQRRRLPVCLGIGAEHTFFATRPFDHERQRPPSLEDLLAATGAGSVWEASQMVADHVKLEKFKLTGRPVYSVAASRRALAEELFSGLKHAGVQNFRLEPSPWSVLDAIDQRARPPKRWKFVVRVLLDESGGLALFVAEDQPLLWRRFTLGRQQAAQTAASAVRAILVHAAVSLGIRNVDGVVVQGNGAERLATHIADDLGMEAVAVAGEGFTDELCSYALALSAKRDEQSFDLFRSLRPPPSIREMFPWKLAAFVAAIAACMGLLLWDRSATLAGHLEGLRQQNTSHKWARGRTTPAINQERKQLVANVGAVSRFLSTRVVWSDYLRDLPTRLPPNACLSNISGFCELKDMGKKKQKRQTNKSLTLRGAARFAHRWAAPEEIDAFLAGLRDVESLQRDFPRVQLAEIKWRRQGDSEIALFTIIALPRNEDLKDQE